MKKMTLSQASTIVGGTFFYSYCRNGYEILAGVGGKATCYSVRTCTDKHGVITKKLTVTGASNCSAN